MTRTTRVATALFMVGALLLPTLAARADPPVPVEDTLAPGEPVARDFPADFRPRLPLDQQEERASVKNWKDPHVGGWGGNLASGASCAGWSAAHPGSRDPVIFFHGTTLDAEFWRQSSSGDGTVVNVRDRFLAEGYDPCQLWAISYDGSPGYFTYTDINTEEAAKFIVAVRDYLGASAVYKRSRRHLKVTIIGHSLGVVVTRKAAFVHPELYAMIGTFVGLAGPNHGSTDCIGLGTLHASYVCEEDEPGSAWLAELNAGPRGQGEAPRGPRWLTVYEGTGLTDNFYLGPDAKSPRLDAPGVCNHQIPLAFHNSLGASEPSVSYYLAFVKGGACI